jgi:hypothetical protein
MDIPVKTPVNFPCSPCSPSHSDFGASIPSEDVATEAERKFFPSRWPQHAAEKSRRRSQEEKRASEKERGGGGDEEQAVEV